MYSPEMKAAVLADYQNDVPYDIMQERYNVSVVTITNWAKKAGVYHPRKCGRPPGKMAVNSSPEELLDGEWVRGSNGIKYWVDEA